MKIVVYVHGSKRAGKTALSELLVLHAVFGGFSASIASIIGNMREYLKAAFDLTDAHVHRDLKEEPLEHCNGFSARNLMDDFVDWHFKRDPSRMCFLRGCMADIGRRDDQLVCIQDVIHEHEPAYIEEAARAAGAVPFGIHVSRPGYTDTYGVNMPPDRFQGVIVNDDSLKMYFEAVDRLYADVIRPRLSGDLEGEPDPWSFICSEAHVLS